jgi:hypothetical protein
MDMIITEEGAWFPELPRFRYIDWYAAKPHRGKSNGDLKQSALP